MLHDRQLRIRRVEHHDPLGRLKKRWRSTALRTVKLRFQNTDRIRRIEIVQRDHVVFGLNVELVIKLDDHRPILLIPLALVAEHIKRVGCVVGLEAIGLGCRTPAGASFAAFCRGRSRGGRFTIPLRQDGDQRRRRRILKPIAEDVIRLVFRLDIELGDQVAGFGHRLFLADQHDRLAFVVNRAGHTIFLLAAEDLIDERHELHGVAVLDVDEFRHRRVGHVKSLDQRAGFFDLLVGALHDDAVHRRPIDHGQLIE